ncbi:hypothetical protein B0H14DRAFT_2904375 [Mycena olivaceomarginata]|nr:hypothetical protein B0H14DRAFT_2904375 [Mycena olivaceomarginata]
MSTPDIPTTMGRCSSAVSSPLCQLSGAVNIQALLYLGHTSKINYIPWRLSHLSYIGMSETCSNPSLNLFRSFFAHRIWRLSKRNWLMVSPVVILAFFVSFLRVHLLRLTHSTGTTYQMFHYKAFDLFKLHARWIFTLGLSFHPVDIIITGLLFYLFRDTSRKLASTLKDVIDRLMLYAFETGSLTWCWIAMSQNLIFLGLHFFIGKYATDRKMPYTPSFVPSTPGRDPS